MSRIPLRSVQDAPPQHCPAPHGACDGEGHSMNYEIGSITARLKGAGFVHLKGPQTSSLLGQPTRASWDSFARSWDNLSEGLFIWPTAADIGGDVMLLSDMPKAYSRANLINRTIKAENITGSTATFSVGSSRCCPSRSSTRSPRRYWTAACRSSHGQTRCRRDHGISSSTNSGLRHRRNISVDRHLKECIATAWIEFSSCSFNARTCATA